MKKFICLLLAFAAFTFVSCGDDEDVNIPESELVGIWILYNNQESAVFNFKEDHTYAAVFGKNTRNGTWEVSGGTIICQYSEFVLLQYVDLNEIIEFTEYNKGVGKVKYSNSKGDKYDFTAEKSQL